MAGKGRSGSGRRVPRTVPASARPSKSGAPLPMKLAAAVLAPLLTLGALEGALRVAGFGFPTAFLTPLDATAWTTNLRFGWRFFPRELARAPAVQRIARRAGPETVRVLVLGGSAAMGTPDSAYGLPRHLEALLAARGPDGVGFELVNGAMTAINSHVVREIARDCARLAPDVVLVYMGNNEVVGPFGPGTVFHGLARSPALIRLSLWAKSLRFGQLLDRSLAAIGGGGPPAWRGMEMFVGHRVAADDPRLAQVEAGFERNLGAIVETSRRAGAEVVLSTVAVNLSGCPPFASVRRDGMRDAERQRFQASYELGTSLLRAGRQAEAVAAFEDAAAVDDGFADLHFRFGQALSALGSHRAAREHFVRARDLDALRFRADSRINAVVRKVAEAWRGRGVHLVDAEAALVGPVSGEDPAQLFYEHVHFTFEGTAALAAALAPAVLEAAGLGREGSVDQEPVDLVSVAERLGFSACERYRLLREIHGMMLRPPFTAQLDHDSRARGRAAELAALWAQVAGREAECAAWQRRAVERHPDDLDLRRKLAALEARSGRPADAVREWSRLVEAVPAVPEWRSELGFALIDSGRREEGLALFRDIARTAHDAAGAWSNLGYVLRGQGDLDGAEKAYRRALAHQARRGEAWAGLAEVELARGRRKAAKDLYREALGHDPGFAEGLVGLGFLDEQDGLLQEAEAHYRAAVAVAPHLASAWNNLGYLLHRQGRVEEAERCLRQSLTADPAHELAAFNLADLLLESGRAGEAVAAYRLGLLAAPGNLQARANLAESLRLSGREGEARSELEMALRLAEESGRKDMAEVLASRLGDGARSGGR